MKIDRHHHHHHCQHKWLKKKCSGKLHIKNEQLRYATAAHTEKTQTVSGKAAQERSTHNVVVDASGKFFRRPNVYYRNTIDNSFVFLFLLVLSFLVNRCSHVWHTLKVNNNNNKKHNSTNNNDNQNDRSHHTQKTDSKSTNENLNTLSVQNHIFKRAFMWSALLFQCEPQ